MTRSASLYVGRTTHARRGPRPHRFSYGVFHILIDVDRVADAVHGLRLLKHGRHGLFSFTERDHGARDGSSLRTWAKARLAEAGLSASADRIRLLTFPRVIGFVFNPISIFFVEDAYERLEAVIYEVNNTFGQTHAYIAPTQDVVRRQQEVEKKLYVSPFYGVEGAYRFRITPPSERFNLVITKLVAGEVDFTATLSATKQPLTDWSLLKIFFAMPLMTLGVVAAIHWQALRLWLKGIPLVARPAGSQAGTSAGRASPSIS